MSSNLGYSLWKCDNCKMLNYNTKQSKCISCFTTKKMEFEVSEELELFYSFLDQCLNLLLQYGIDDRKPYDLRMAIHLMIAFPFYQSKIYQKFMSTRVRQMTLQNLPDYKMDFYTSTWGYKCFDLESDIVNDNIKLKQLLIENNNWGTPDDKVQKYIHGQLNSDLNQRIEWKEPSSKENRIEKYNFFKLSGLNFEQVFDNEYHKKDIERLPKYLLVALFKDNRKPLMNLKTFGMNSMIEDDAEIRKCGTIICIKNDDLTKTFIYRATKTHQNYHRSW